MQPHIQYAQRPDGARTAYATMGSGPLLVVPPGGITHIEWYLGDTEAQRRFCQRLAQQRTLVLYDRHGCGLSDRRRTDFTPEDDLLDLETVIEVVGGPPVDLLGISWGGTPALGYAATHPENVRRLVLYGTFADGRQSERTQARRDALRTLRRADPEAYIRAEAARFFPSGTDPETFQSLVRMLRNSTTVEMAEQLEQVVFNNQDVLSQITTPALVLHRRGDLVCLFAWGQYLARRLPNAQFVPLEGDAHYPWVDDAESVLRPMIEFLTGEPRAAAADVPGTATILFADIADSTALTERLGDAAFRDRARELDAALRTLIRDANGTAVEGKLLGDGVLATFGAARDAIACARACHGAARRVDLALHAGIHAGDVIREDGNVFGGAVNVASRVAGEAGAGETLVSQTVRDLARTSAGVTFDDRGERDLKGVGDPVRLYGVRWQ
jgi:class 3 adenylate cyclase